MADLSITATSVVAGADSVQEPGIAGEAVTAGQPLYKDPTTRQWFKADSNSATAAARHALGIALNGAAASQPVIVHKSGDITIGATLTLGAPYYLSETPGGIEPLADQGAGEYVCLLGTAKSTTVLAVNIQFPGISL